MAYTNAWSTTIPVGSLAANQIDTAIQQARLDIAERINTLIGSAGSMSTDPAINGTTAKSLTDLTTELATKSTLAGLTTGLLIKATGASAIGNSALTEASVVAALAVINSPLLADSNNTTNAVKHTVNVGASGGGIYIVTFNGAGCSTVTLAEIKGNGYSFEQYIVSGTTEFTHTAVIDVDNSDDIELICNAGTSGTFSYLMKKIGP